ncbi:YciI family protein [Streptosporangium sp. NPDC051023]|uniref:YciI family protein n=1 Tax=Streptosporangium sp. NPDC051023 TaxID=3155410 RepID=UPI00344E37B2
MSKYMLIMHISPKVMENLSETDRNEIMSGHGAFQEKIKETGEFVSTHALGDPSNSAVVSVNDGVTSVKEGPLLDSELGVGGYYIVECESKERAYEVAALIPDAKIDGLGVEVRPIVFSAGAVRDGSE